ncbi:sulfurtransferase TusA family protein [Glaesserella sp.]|uniref:sulfurtransferase TusA family protein n=1 Tax=Glaesserella sp. TaxID=2094731 RepID=UPI00359F561A
MEYQLDLSDYRCPLPVLMTKRALHSLMPGERLSVIVRHDVSLNDFALLCEKIGARLLQSECLNNGKWTLQFELQAVSSD